MARRITGLAVASLLPTAGLGTEPYESPATLDAGSVLAGTPLPGRGWRIEQAVRSDGRMNHYRVQGPAGPVEAVGDALARERAREFEAVAAIRQIETTEAYAGALERTGRRSMRGCSPRRCR